MAYNKEAIAIVLDVGPGMNQAAPGESTDLETSLIAVRMILQRKLFSESKDEIALVLFGTPDTDNHLSDGETYANITLAKTLSTANWDLLQYVQDDIHPSNVSGDFISALVVAMDHLVKGIQGKRGFASKRIILLSNLCGEFGDEHLDDIVSSLKDEGIEFDVIGPDVDEDDEDDDDSPRPSTSNSHHQKPKTMQQRAGEALVKHIQEGVEGSCFSYREALQALSHYQSRQVRSTAWKCNMEIGPELKIPICLYTKLKEVRAKSFKNVHARDPEAQLERLRTYHLNNEEETEIEKDDTADGHCYGSTIVPFSEDDKDAMKYRSEKCFKVFGFTRKENVKYYHKMGDSTWICVANKDDEAAAVALSALINALYETDCVAIVRRVYQANGQVKIGCLVPQIEADCECLVYNELPFAEDVRCYAFGSLPVAPSASAKQKSAPSEKQLKLMDQLIDDMDLSKVEMDDEQSEPFDPKLTFNPYLQRLYQCMQHRALNPDDPLVTELSEVVRQALEPPQSVLTQCEATLEQMRDNFKLKKVEQKSKDSADAIFQQRDEGPEAKKPKTEDTDRLTGGMADIVWAEVQDIGTVTPVEDFQTLLSRKDKDMFEEACAMMAKRIIQLVTESFGALLYPKALQCIQAFRQQAIKAAEPKTFNEFFKSFKDTLREKGRKDFWDLLVKDKLSLISKMESEDSAVSQPEADAFIKADEDDEETEPEATDDADDLLAEMA